MDRAGKTAVSLLILLGVGALAGGVPHPSWRLYLMVRVPSASILSLCLKVNL